MATSLHEHVNLREPPPALTPGVDVPMDVAGFFIRLRPRCSVKIRRIRVDPRAMGIHDRPLMDADSIDLRG